MPRPGRPRRTRELKEIRELLEGNRTLALGLLGGSLPQKFRLSPFIEIMRNVRAARQHQDSQLDKTTRIARQGSRFAVVAARVLFTLEHGTNYQKVHCERLVKELLQFAHENGPHGRWQSHSAFLKDFIATHAPDWDWRSQTEDRNEAEEREARDERDMHELAEMLRDSKAHRNRHVLPERPDPSRLIILARRIRPNEPISWATLKELKLATGLSERTIRGITKSMHPKKSEIVTKTPKRFAPRLVLGVIVAFLERLPDMQTDSKTRSDCFAAARIFQECLSDY
jgi:hypothetical protein